MISDHEATTTTSSSLTAEFTKALHLLHSSEPGSAEELRVLLEASIAKRYGAERTTHVSLPNSRYRYEGDERTNADGKRLATGHFTDSGGNDVGGKDEVPRISIPDEEQNDVALCKVCNVPEFGPLILIQCRECGELYHPLCHQPPLVDARVNDPDFLWQCKECEVGRASPARSSSRMRDAFFKDSVWVRGDEMKMYSKKAAKQTLNGEFAKR